MNRIVYDKIYNNLTKKLDKEHIIEFDSIKECTKILSDTEHISPKLYSEIEELSNLFSLRWGLLSLSISDNKSKSKDIQDQCMIYQSLTNTIANNCLAITNLSKKGLEFQANVLMRNTCEICFLLLVLLLDKEKCKEYFLSISKNNEYEVWSKNFRFKKLNETLEIYEQTFEKEQTLFLSDWRKKEYSYYSGYVHNDFFNCFAQSYVVDENNEENLKLNIWGIYNNKVRNQLSNLNDLMFFISKYFIKITSNINIFDKNIYISENGKEFWNESASLAFFIDELYVYYKGVEE